MGARYRQLFSTCSCEGGLQSGHPGSRWALIAETAGPGRIGEGRRQTAANLHLAHGTPDSAARDPA